MTAPIDILLTIVAWFALAAILALAVEWVIGHHPPQPSIFHRERPAPTLPGHPVRLRPRERRPMNVVKGFLIVRAASDLRVTKRRPLLRWDEFAFPREFLREWNDGMGDEDRNRILVPAGDPLRYVAITVPDIWGEILATHIDVVLPDPPEPEIVVGGHIDQ